MQGSYIKEHEPGTYRFFMEYWNFVKKYWNKTEDTDWWNCFLADLEYLVSVYYDNDFFVSLLMQLYVKSRDEEDTTTSIEELKKFYKEWWEYVNKYYKSSSERKWWDDFMNDTKRLLKKYKGNRFFSETIDIFVHSQLLGN